MTRPISRISRLGGEHNAAGPRPERRREPSGRVRPQHQAFIQSMPCLCCGRPAPSEAAHVRNGADGGMGLKPSARFLLPLCHDCHARQHQVGEITFWAALNIDPLDYSARFWAVTGDYEQGMRTCGRAWQAIALHRREG